MKDRSDDLFGENDAEEKCQRSSELRSVFGTHRVVQNLSCDSLAVSPSADLSPAISSLVVDPGYPRDHNQGVRSVAN
jgi:hypothetical protein